MFFKKKPDLEKLKVAINSALFGGKSIKDHGFLQGLSFNDSQVTCLLEIPMPFKEKAEEIRQTVEKEALKHLKNNDLKILITLKKEPPKKQPIAQPQIPDFAKNIIAISSAKGGVGKSTIASNIACMTAQMGYKVGLLDADIYGPSVPNLFGLQGQKPKQTDNGKIQPFEAHGIKLISIGFMIDQDAPLIWRGPMVQSALLQLYRDVDWGQLDYLFIDLPPGTGDIQLTLSQKLKLTGAVIISTPQDIALIDARKGLKMFEKTNTPILGIIENMSYHICTNCGETDHIFGHAGAKQEAENLNVPFLGEIPLNKAIREQADNGTPLVMTNSDLKSFYQEITKNMIANIETTQRQAPKIEFIA